ncbi:hypothetical protein CQW23_06218 [Capsicum baccatum]|uniref:Uncharacterized protein n=1 Tax=Capsicum baccatum TaxID=33114 RepID=A0A2G2X2M9_CAPBA|nr:hypothetical protein CQW23_06218 [Capsicum baccatum]
MELQNYHDNMIGKLQLWKESLESCKDSEEEMVERILRLQLANKDVPAGFAKWIKKRSQELQLRTSLGQEMEQKLNAQIKGKEKRSSDTMI